MPVQTGSLPSVRPERHIEPVVLEAVEAWVALREWLQPTNLPRTKCICGLPVQNAIPPAPWQVARPAS